jgi:hypothetical protein
VKEYWESGAGCAQFVRKFPRSPLSTSRVRQLVAVLGAGAVGVAFPLYAVYAIVAGAVVLGIASAWTDRRLRAAAYPAITLVLGLVFSLAMTYRLAAGAIRRRETAVGRHQRLDAAGLVLCGGSCEKVVRVPGVGDDLAVDLARAAATT